MIAFVTRTVAAAGYYSLRCSALWVIVPIEKGPTFINSRDIGVNVCTVLGVLRRRERRALPDHCAYGINRDDLFGLFAVPNMPRRKRCVAALRCSRKQTSPISFRGVLQIRFRPFRSTCAGLMAPSRGSAESCTQRLRNRSEQTRLFRPGLHPGLSKPGTYPPYESQLAAETESRTQSATTIRRKVSESEKQTASSSALLRSCPMSATASARTSGVSCFMSAWSRLTPELSRAAKRRWLELTVSRARRSSLQLHSSRVT